MKLRVGASPAGGWPAGRAQPAALRRMMLRAPPARNHSICSSFMVWVALKATTVPSGLWISPRHRLVGGQIGQAEQRDAVLLADLVVGGRVGEPQRQHALLLQVGLGDAGEASGR